MAHGERHHNQRAPDRRTRTGDGGTQMQQHWDVGAEESTATPWVDPNKRSSSSGSLGQALVFPSNLGTDPTQQNWMMFWPKEIVNGGADSRTLTFGPAEGNYPSVALPIPTGLNETYQQSWSQATVEGSTAMLTDKGGSIIRAVSSALHDTPDAQTGEGTITGILGALTEGASFSGVGNAMMDAFSAVRRADWWNTAAGGVASELGAMAAAKPLEGIATASQYTSGMRAVKQTIQSYGGPSFRSFTYNFSLKPLNARESMVCHAITQLFKEFSAPNQRSTRYTRVYDLPGVFKIMFYYGGQEHPHIGKIGHCALTNIGITYGGDKFTTFDETHSPVQFDIALSFSELELLNRSSMQTEKYGGSSWPNYKGSAGNYANTSTTTQNTVYAPRRTGIS